MGANNTGALKYDEAVDSSCMINDYFESKDDLIRDNDYMQSVVVDLTGCLYEELIRRDVTKHPVRSTTAACI